MRIWTSETCWTGGWDMSLFMLCKNSLFFFLTVTLVTFQLSSWSEPFEKLRKLIKFAKFWQTHNGSQKWEIFLSGGSRLLNFSRKTGKLLKELWNVKFSRYISLQDWVAFIAKLSPNFSFSWAEKVLILDFPYPPPSHFPPTHRTTEPPVELENSLWFDKKYFGRSHFRSVIFSLV